MSGDDKRSPWWSLKEIVAPLNTVLVVFDVQIFLLHMIFNREEFVTNLSRILDSARRASVPVVYTKVGAYPQGYESSWRTFMLMKRYGVSSPDQLPKTRIPGNPESEIASEIGPEKGEFILQKFTPSLFIGTNFEILLRNRGVKTIVFTGIATDIGIDSSVRDSSNRGFYTIVVRDCVSSWDRNLHDCSLQTLENVSLIVSGEEISAAWRGI